MGLHVARGRAGLAGLTVVLAALLAEQPQLSLWPLTLQ